MNTREPKRIEWDVLLFQIQVAMQQIASFQKVEDAELFRAFLESEGIDATVRDALTVNQNWMLGQAIGGVKIDVAEADVPRAMVLLQQHHPELVIPADPVRSSHGVGRYVKISATVAAGALLFIAMTVGFENEVPAIWLVLAALGIGAAIGTMCAMFNF